MGRNLARASHSSNLAKPPRTHAAADPRPHARPCPPSRLSRYPPCPPPYGGAVPYPIRTQIACYLAIRTRAGKRAFYLGAPHICNPRPFLLFVFFRPRYKAGWRCFWRALTREDQYRCDQKCVVVFWVVSSLSRAIFETQESRRSVHSLGLFSPFFGRDLIFYTPGSGEHGPRFLTGGPEAAPGGVASKNGSVYMRVQGEFNLHRLFCPSVLSQNGVYSARANKPSYI